MDGESSYESDISESWSLIEINLNKESVSAINAQSGLDDTYLSNPEDVNRKKSDSIELEDFVRQCRESMTDFHRCCHSDSDSSLENHEVLKMDGSEDRNDSCDAESIEILDLEGNHRDSEIEKLDISLIDSQELKNSTYQSDDEESWEENVDRKFRNNSSTVIKRKRNLVRHSESSDNIVNSDIISNENSNLSSHSSDEKKWKVQSCATSNQPVYKHYRNNVVNTVLSLSMGVIFAGVACIAIGHFLGVHDAAETAVELVDALKKLQMENVALQSRLSQLNRAVLKRDVNSKFELPSAKQQETISCEERPNFGPARTKTTNINHVALSEIRSSLKSIQWLTKLEDVINEKDENEDKIDFSSVGKYINDQLNLLNNKKVEGLKLLEDSDKKISKILQKIIERLSASQDSIEKLYNRLIRLKDKMNHKLARLFPDEPQRKLPVTESDLYSVQRHRSKESSESPRAFKFPQPEEFYKLKNDSAATGEQIGSKNNKIKTQKDKDERKVKKEGKRRRKREKNWRKEKSKDVEKKFQKKPKYDIKTIEKVGKKKHSESEPEEVKYTFGKFNETKENCKKFPKEKEEEKPKREMKKMKKSKIIRGVFSKPKKGSHLKKNRYSRICSGNECFNLTGYWVFKYADGREEFRRHQTLSDWQFERAKGRKEQRNEDDVGSWQFRRALARENGRNDHRWRPERYRKNYDTQDFIHEEFSWI